MSALQLLVTSAGLAALTAAAGSDAITIAEVGFTDAAFLMAPTLTALPGEFVRHASIAGVAASANLVHLTVRDSSAASYTLRGFGLYLADGTLFAVYGQADPISQKAGLATYLLSIDIAFVNGEGNAIAFGDLSFAYPPATETTMGVALRATQAKVDAGADAESFVTPLTLAGRLAAILMSLAGKVAATRQVLTSGLATGGGDLSADRTINVPIATAAEADAGAIGNKALVPASLANILTTLAAKLSKATSAEIKAGLADDKGITPKGLRDAQTYVAGANGYRITPDGHVEMWGQYRGTHTGEDVIPIAFPAAFPQACDNVQLTGLTNNASGVRDMWPQVIESTRTLNGFSVQLQSDDSENRQIDGFDWRAIGR